MELKEPQDYYPIPEEPEGELIDYDAISKTYKTGDKQYTTVYGGYVGTYKNEDGDTELVDNTLVKPEEADTPASEEAQEASSVVATEEKERENRSLSEQGKRLCYPSSGTDVRREWCND